MNRIRYFLVRTGLLCSLCLINTQAWAALTAHLDRQRITEGETVRLTIEAAGQIAAMPDTRALHQDFEVTGAMSGSRVNIVNGKMDSRTTWTISLIPLRSGELNHSITQNRWRIHARTETTGHRSVSRNGYGCSRTDFH
ncbi:MAG: BatD family protein [Burkholderiales bacterium]|nr:BatD family protein [Burkholderiales bacterium]